MVGIALASNEVEVKNELDLPPEGVEDTLVLDCIV